DHVLYELAPAFTTSTLAIAALSFTTTAATASALTAFAAGSAALSTAATGAAASTTATRAATSAAATATARATTATRTLLRRLLGCRGFDILVLVVCHLLKLQPALAGSVGYAFHAAVIFVSSSVENYTRHT